jgi:hypothetical protein
MRKYIVKADLTETGTDIHSINRLKFPILNVAIKQVYPHEADTPSAGLLEIEAKEA